MRLPIKSVLLIANSLLITQAKDCFTPKGGSSRELDKNPQRISEGFICPDAGSQKCEFTSTGYATAHRYLNMTDLSDDQTRDIFDAVKDATSEEFEESAVGSNVGSLESFTLDAGQAGYIALVPLYNCFNGTLGDCIDGVKDGTAVKACGPVVDEDGHLGKDVKFVTTSVEEAREMTTNPREEEPNAGAELNVHMGLLSLLVAVTGLWGMR